MAVRISILALALGLLATIAMAQQSAERPGGPAPIVPPSPNEVPTPAHAPTPSPSAKPPSVKPGSSPPPSEANGPAGQSPADSPQSADAAPVPTIATAWIATAAVALVISAASVF